MNYRHAFHAGNFADLVKHAALISVLSRLLASPTPLTVIDTHAGAGRYDLDAPEAKRSKEAEAGIVQLMQGEAPAPLIRLRDVVRGWNPKGGVRFYPGSPAIAAGLLRPEDRLVACELRPDDAGLLEETLRPFGRKARVAHADGWAALEEVVRQTEGSRLFALIDPPFERADDYWNLADSLGTTLDAQPDACVMAWLPLKDLETLDACVRRIEAAGPYDILVAETRLRPLIDPMRLNGCALILANAPTDAEPEIGEVCGFVAAALGDRGGGAKLWRP